MNIEDIIQLLLLIATILGLMIAFRSIRNQAEAFKQQMKVSLFADYTKRYQEIVLHLPEDINTPEFDLKALKETHSDQYDLTMRYMRIYFDLCSEEYYLYSEGKIDEKVWKEWSGGIKYSFSNKAYKDAWEIANTYSHFYSEFEGYVKEHILPSDKSSDRHLTD